MQDALNKNIPFHIFCRYGNQMEILLATSFLDVKESYSNRQRKLLDRCEIKRK